MPTLVVWARRLITETLLIESEKIHARKKQTLAILFSCLRFKASKAERGVGVRLS